MTERMEPSNEAPRGHGLRIGLVLTQFNKGHSENMRLACVERLIALDVDPNDIETVRVPGALEAPFALQLMAESGDFDALICLGTVIRGDTYHFEVVSNESARGITNVQISTGVPIANGILTCDTEEQVLARVKVKAADCADVAISMARLAEELNER